MMLYPAMNELLEQVPSRYKLVNVVAARARQIAAQAESQDIMLEDKPVSIAIQPRASCPRSLRKSRLSLRQKKRRRPFLPGNRSGNRREGAAP